MLHTNASNSRRFFIFFDGWNSTLILFCGSSISLFVYTKYSAVKQVQYPEVHYVNNLTMQM
jgi:hypothetical protein